MPRVAILPMFTVHDGHRDDFLKRVRQQQSDCLREEPGCLYFDVLHPTEGEEVVLYEVYEDAAALEKHRTYPHYASFKEDTNPWVKALDIRSFELDDAA